MILLEIVFIIARYEEATEILQSIVWGCKVRMPLALETAIYRGILETIYCVPRMARSPLAHFISTLSSLQSYINPQQVSKVVYALVHLLICYIGLSK